MRRTIKIYFFSFITGGLLLSFMPAFASAASTTPAQSANGGTGLNVCSGSEQDYKALQNFFIQYKQPLHNDKKYQNADGTVNETAYDLDMQAWQTKYNDFLAQHPGICQTKDIYRVIAKITNYLIGFAGAFAVLRMLFGGYLMVGFPGDESAVKKANEILLHSFYGLIMVYGAYIAVNFFFIQFGIVQKFPFPFNFFQ